MESTLQVWAQNVEPIYQNGKICYFRRVLNGACAILVMAMVMAECGVKKSEDLGILPIMEKICHSFHWFLQHLACENKEKWQNFHKWKCHED